jgi:hypothetical protein
VLTITLRFYLNGKLADRQSKRRRDPPVRVPVRCCVGQFDACERPYGDASLKGDVFAREAPAFSEPAHGC